MKPLRPGVFVGCLLLAFAPALSAQSSSGGRIDGSGRMMTQERPLSGFSAVRVAGPIDIDLKAASRERVSVKFDDNLLELVETRVVPGNPAALEIRMADGGRYTSRTRPVVTVEFTSLSGLALKGSGKASIDNVRGQSLKVEIAGSGDVSAGSLEVARLDVSVAGSGDFTAKGGRAEEQNYSIAGSGNANAETVAGRKANVSIAGSGNARVNVDQSLDVQIAGSGDVVYANKPAVTKRVVGSGSVRPR